MSATASSERAFVPQQAQIAACDTLPCPVHSLDVRLQPRPGRQTEFTGDDPLRVAQTRVVIGQRGHAWS